MTDTGDISRIMVIGAGVMGSGIAAHAASAGASVALLDILPPGGLTEQDRAAGLTEQSRAWRDRLAATGVQRALAHRPPLFYDPADAGRITAGNLEDDLALVGEMDWIIEAIPENPAMKQSLYARIEQFRQPGTIVSSNTSGILMETLLEGRSEHFRRHFLITHFFNPVRYMKLLELIGGPETDSKVMDRIARFSRNALGKGLVFAKNTPGFVANRIGVHALNTAASRAVEAGLRPEDADALTGAFIGRSSSATFRTLDLVGLDTMTMVDDNLCATCPDDPDRDDLKAPDILRKLVAAGLLGNKSKAGFYRIDKAPDGGRAFMSMRWDDLTYRPQQVTSFASVEAAAAQKDVGARLRAVFAGDDPASRYLWQVVRDQLVYTALRVPEISDTLSGVDNGMKWGYAWTHGPFELWDALGVAFVADRLRTDGVALPPVVDAVLSEGEGSFYLRRQDALMEFDPVTHRYRPVEIPATWLDVRALRSQHPVLIGGKDCSVVELEKDIHVAVLHSKGQLLTEEALDILTQAVAKAEEAGATLILTGEGAFCKGLDPRRIDTLLDAGDQAGLDSLLGRVQTLGLRLRSAAVPVVAAVTGAAFGAGLDLLMCCGTVAAGVETRFKLADLPAGILPFGAGLIELHRRLADKADIQGPNPPLERLYDLTLTGGEAANAIAARNIGYLRKNDLVVFDEYAVLGVAREVGRSRAGMSARPQPQQTVRLPGPGVAERLLQGNDDEASRKRDSVLDQDARAAVALLLTGGETSMAEQLQAEQWLACMKETVARYMVSPDGHAHVKKSILTDRPSRS